jgi:[ribosomal protein S18]-alanine N-acetyltransferase
MTGAVLRAATPEDVTAIMRIESAVFAGDAWSEEIMGTEVASEHTYYLVAVDPDAADVAARVVGYAGLFASAGNPQADIQTIAVAPEARRRGLGRALMVALLAAADNRGVAEVFLDVRADNAGAQTLYASLGFEPIGRRPNYYPDGNMDAIVMRARRPASTGSNA